MEIDLLRAGQRIPLGRPLPKGFDYYVLVCRAREMPNAGVWPFTVREQFPKFPIPLGPSDADVTIDLRACLDWAYEQARYERDIDYAQPPIPPLAQTDAAWATELLAQRKE